MKTLEELTREIREKLPRLKELETGCIIDFKDITVKYIVSHKFRDLFQNNYYLSSPNYYGDPEPRGRQIFKYHEQDYISQYSLDEGLLSGDINIIGKDPMLNDLLEWLTIIDLYNISVEFSNQEFSIVKDNSLVDHLDDYDFEGVAWDLSKPYLKDQSPELITFLHGLINQ